VVTTPSRLAVLLGVAGAVSWGIAALGQYVTLAKVGLATAVAGAFVSVGQVVILPPSHARPPRYRVLGVLMLIGLAVVEIQSWRNASGTGTATIFGLVLVGVPALLLFIDAATRRRRTPQRGRVYER
jgi:hypothetical protein